LWFPGRLSLQAPDGPSDPLHPLYYQRPRCGDVDADETCSAGAEPVPAVQGDAPLFHEDVLQFRSRKVQGTAVQERNVGGAQSPMEAT